MIEVLEVIAWPVTVAICALGAVWILKKPISGFIDRTQRITLPKGGEITTKEDQMERVRSQKPVDSLSDGEDAIVSAGVEPNRVSVRETFQSPMLLEQAQSIKEHLDNLSFQTPADREELLLKSIAANQIALSFERTYHLIFGSQIKALQFLAQQAVNGTAEIEELRPVYNEAEKFGLDHSKTSFDAWLGFLGYSVFVQMNYGKIAITGKGREFLKYLIDRNYPFFKGN